MAESLSGHKIAMRIFGWVNGTKRGTTKSNSYTVRPFCTYEYNPVPNGVYIYDKDNNRYTKEEWVSSGKGVSAVCGIGISTDTNSFMVSTSKHNIILLVFHIYRERRNIRTFHFQSEDSYNLWLAKRSLNGGDGK
jgi:hypothetical protein